MYGGASDDLYVVDSQGDGAGYNTFYVDNAADTVVGAGMVYSNADNWTMSGQLTDAILSDGNPILGGTGKNITGNAGDNGITGNGQSNLIQGGGGNDLLYTDSGYAYLHAAAQYDILQGGAGSDTLFDNGVWGAQGASLLDGGADNDHLMGSANNNLLIGGKGNDVIDAGYYLSFSANDDIGPSYGATGHDILAYNKGDGQDTVHAGDGAKLTLSLGGGINYSDLAFSKSGNDLVLKTGVTDSITFSDWYVAPILSNSTQYDTKSVLNLQVIAEAMTGFVQGGTDALRNNRIENFNFADLVHQFDTEGATANWQLTDARLTAHLLAGSDTAAMGGDLAYQYGRNGTLAGVGLTAAQSVLSDTRFGTAAQAFSATLPTEAVMLG